MRMQVVNMPKCPLSQHHAKIYLPEGIGFGHNAFLAFGRTAWQQLQWLAYHDDVHLTWLHAGSDIQFIFFQPKSFFNLFYMSCVGSGSIRAQARRRIRYIVFATGVFSPATFSTFCCIETEYSSIEFHLLNTTAKCLKLSWLILKSLLFDNKVSIQFVVLLLYTVEKSYLKLLKLNEQKVSRKSLSSLFKFSNVRWWNILMFTCCTLLVGSAGNAIIDCIQGPLIPREKVFNLAHSFYTYIVTVLQHPRMCTY